MRDTQIATRGTAPRFFGWLLVGILALSTTGCVYNDHLVFGATEKWVASDTHMIPKTLGTIVIAPFDAVFAPWFMIADQLVRDEQYSPNHKYISFSGSRTVARSGMAWGYHDIATIFALPIDIVYLPLTGLIDIVWVLTSDDDGCTGECEGESCEDCDDD